MAKRHLLQDLLIIAASIAIAWAIVHYSLVELLLAQLGGGKTLVAFVAGLFFTSITTTAPAIAVLGELSLTNNLFFVAIVGGAGAVIGDYLIFMFVRDRVSEDIAYLLKHTGTPRVFKLFHRKTFRRLLPFLGGLIIASPLPDELGLTLLGLAHMRTSRFILLSFAFNTGGILLIGLAARSLAS
jgi:hypothetical protein